MITLTKRETEDLLELIEHTRRDISYHSGGTFGNGENFDAKAARRVERAVERLKVILLTGN